MPYLLLIFGLILGIYALYRFFISADIHQIKALMLAAVTITICLALFVMAVTGRLPAAIALISALAPFILAWYTRRRAHQRANHEQTPHTRPMDRAEALEVLGLSEDAGEDEIKSAYKSLMKKVHPDQQGSGWMAEKLNEAKDLLLKK